MAVYNIGDKVTVKMNPSLYPSMSNLNGHIFVVSKTMNFGGNTMYSLRWEKEDNPGRTFDFPVGAVAWSYEELIPCFNTPAIKTIKSIGLPDV